MACAEHHAPVAIAIDCQLLVILAVNSVLHVQYGSDGFQGSLRAVALQSRCSQHAVDTEAVWLPKQQRHKAWLTSVVDHLHPLLTDVL